jgi:sterol desaturase/sphingolipid hydroxylase (fatty acid hydroxylase superfamily)
MTDEATSLLLSAARSLRIAIELLALSAAGFGFLALLVKGAEAIQAFRRAATELRVNLGLYLFDAIFIAPVLAVLIALTRQAVAWAFPALTTIDLWSWAGRYGTFVAVLFLGDFISYGRHRLEHTRLLWPMHAIHHSDQAMSWITLVRFHPLNRVTTAVIDTGCLALFGFPEWALVANVMFRHYYGEFIHADLPWTYGPLAAVFVSPVMHRWHHARDVVGVGSNFATVFSVFDRAFGTYYVPGLCTVPLGVTDEMGAGAAGQLAYPFVAWQRRFSDWWASRRAGRAEEATKPASGRSAPLA